MSQAFFIFMGCCALYMAAHNTKPPTSIMLVDALLIIGATVMFYHAVTP